MDKNAEIFNTKNVKSEYVKNVTHFFCRAVLHECQAYGYGTNFIKAIDTLKGLLIEFSNRHSERGVRPISHSDDLLSYFFNQKNTIPAYVFYWLDYYYSCNYGAPAQYSERHYEVYNALQRAYIQRYRFRKENTKEDCNLIKERRRKVCQLYKSGKYSIAFELYGKPLKNSFKSSDLDNVSDLLVELFGTDLCELSEMDIAAAYMIGVLQGEHNAKTA